MRQRPKQASYLQNMEQQHQLLQQGGAGSRAAGKHAGSGGGAVAVAGAGRMTKFRSLDDIPDGFGPAAAASAADPRDSEMNRDPYEAESSFDRRHSSSEYERNIHGPGSFPYHESTNNATKPSYGLVAAVSPSRGWASPPEPVAQSQSQSPPSGGSRQAAGAARSNSSSGVVAASREGHTNVATRSSMQANHHYKEDGEEEETEYDYFERPQQNRGGYLQQYAAEPVGASASQPQKKKQQQQLQPPREENPRPHAGGGGGGNDGVIPADQQLYYSRNPRKVEYRPYTLGQYKAIRPNTYVEYTNLKPDLNTDELKAKRANADRVREFSKKLRDYNKDEIKTRATSPIDTSAGAGPSRRATPSARDRALEFARNVPKPKIRTDASALVRGAGVVKGRDGESNDYGSAAEENYMSWDYDGGGAGGDSSGVDAALRAVLGGGAGGGGAAAGRLQELEQRHGDNQRKVNAIKKSLGL